MGMLWQDLKYAFRMLAKAPGFTAVAVFTLALGIGTSTAIFSGVNALWFNPVPAAGPDRLVEVRAFNKEQNKYMEGVSAVVLQELRLHRDYFADLTRYKPWGASWEDGGWIEYIAGARVSPNFFSLWSARPWLGRTFAPDEGRPGAPPVVVLSHAFWKGKLGGDPGWIGKKSLRLGDQYPTVIGVMPPHFKFPNFADFWVPAGDPQVGPADKDPQGRRFQPDNKVIARLAPGVSLTQAQAMLEVLARRYEEEHRKQGWGYTLLRARPVREVFAGAEVQKTIPGFVGAMIFVLLIACANVANLNLARAEARQHELAIRGALGAGWFQLLRQLLLESLLVALAGAIAGIALTYWSSGLMERLWPSSLPRVRTIELDWQVLAYSLFLAVMAGLISGTVPAWYGATRPVANALKQTGVQATPGGLRNLYRRGLVVLEVSLAMVLLAGAGLMIQSVVYLLRSNPGFDPTNLIIVQISPAFDSKKYQTLEAKNLLLAEVHRRLSTVPGVEAVGFSGDIGRRKFAVTGQEEPVDLCYTPAGVGSADVFKTMRVPLLRGRHFDEQDLGANATAVIVNETLARRCWPGENALGKTIRSTTADDHSTYEVVGVVADYRTTSLTTQVLPLFFRPHQVGFAFYGWNFCVRTRIKPEGLIKPLLAEVKAAGPDLRKPVVWEIKDPLYNSTRGHRTYMCYLGVFGAVGLLLAGMGVYAVLAYSVAMRTREIGIRMALGAAEAGVVRMVLRQGMTLVGIGIALGLGAACVLTRLLRGMLYGVSPMDPLTLVAGALLLSLIALVACYLPARRAAKIDPMVALRHE
ncbi:MAG: ABC transporter permease [Phycisphaerae bacterium]|nr:ABC transporter permease [Phycisphaerae bacterium]